MIHFQTGTTLLTFHYQIRWGHTKRACHGEMATNKKKRSDRSQPMCQPTRPIIYFPISDFGPALRVIRIAVPIDLPWYDGTYAFCHDADLNTFMCSAYSIRFWSIGEFSKSHSIFLHSRTNDMRFHSHLWCTAYVGTSNPRVDKQTVKGMAGDFGNLPEAFTVADFNQIRPIYQFSILSFGRRLFTGSLLGPLKSVACTCHMRSCSRLCRCAMSRTGWPGPQTHSLLTFDNIAK